MKKALLVWSIIASMVFCSCKSGASAEKKADAVPPVALTQVRITSTDNNGNFDFVTKPVATLVTEAKKGWLEPDDPELQAPEPWYEKCTVSVIDKDGNTLLQEAASQVKVRGNWSSNYEKKPLRIKFNEKQAMSKLHGGKEYKNWVLLAEYKDKSLLRNATALKLAKLLSEDYYASDYELVEVYINNQYWGVYLLAEQQEPKKGRVTLTEDAKSNEIGYMIEYDGNYGYEDFHFTINYNYDGKRPLTDYYGRKITKNASGYSFKSDVTDEQTEFIAGYLQKVYKLCYEAAYENKFYKFDENYNLVPAAEFASAKACVSEVIDLDSLVCAYLHQEIVCDPDMYLNSFFMDVDLSSKNKKKLTFEAPWDFDSALGNKRQCEDGQKVWAGAICPDVNNTDGSKECNPWLMVFINCDWFREMVSAKWKVLKTSGALEALTQQIDFASNSYKASFERNTNRWVIKDETLSFELNDKSLRCKTQLESAEWLKKWLTLRFAALDAIWGK